MGALIVEMYMHIMIAFLEIRNEKHHSKDEKVKQERKKAKTADGVCTLYNLQNQS